MKTDKVKKWLLAIGIAIIFTMFINNGVNTIYNNPQYEDYCDIEDIRPAIPGEVKEIVEDSECKQNYQNAREVFEKNAFIILIVFGVIAVIAGVLIQIESISYGLLIGGILNLFIATMRYWSRLGETLRFVLLGIVLVILIYIAYKKTK